MTAHRNGIGNTSHAEVWWRRKPNPLQHSAEGLRVRFNDLAETNNDEIHPRLVIHSDFSEFKSGLLPCFGPMLDPVNFLFLNVLVLAAAGNKSTMQPPLPPPGCGGEWKETGRNWWVGIRAV